MGRVMFLSVRNKGMLKAAGLVALTALLLALPGGAAASGQTASASAAKKCTKAKAKKRTKHARKKHRRCRRGNNAGCPLAQAGSTIGMTLPRSCTVVRSDTASDPNAANIWGDEIACANNSRVSE